MLNGRYTIFFISALFHALLVVILFVMPVNQIKELEKTPVKAIKSYLYKKPLPLKKAQKILPPIEIIQKEADAQKAVPSKALPRKTEISNQKKSQDKNKNKEKKTTKNEEKPLATLKPTAVKKPSVAKTVKDKKSPVINATFSAHSQLNKLQATIQKQMIEQDFQQRQQHQSASIMHAQQAPVNHSVTHLTLEQEKEKNTKRMSDNISITKNDNGTCTINREQFLGSPVPGSSSSFFCGESKFDKSFREHMKKVQDKLRPTKTVSKGLK